MCDINTTTLVGRLARDPDVRELASGTTLAKFTVAANVRYLTKDGQQREDVAYVPCALFGAPAKWARECKQGEPVAVTGHLVSESWEKDGQKHWRLGLKVREVEFFHRLLATNGQASAVEDKAPF